MKQKSILFLAASLFVLSACDVGLYSAAGSSASSTSDAPISESTESSTTSASESSENTSSVATSSSSTTSISTSSQESTSVSSSVPSAEPLLTITAEGDWPTGSYTKSDTITTIDGHDFHYNLIISTSDALQYRIDNKKDDGIIGFFYNSTALRASKVIIEQQKPTYGTPSLTLYAGDSAQPTGSQNLGVKVENGNVFTYTYTFDKAYDYFNIRNETANAVLFTSVAFYA